MIAYGGGKRLIGRLDDDDGRRTLTANNPSLLELMDRINAGMLVTVTDALNFVSELLPARTPDGRMAMQRICELAPFDNGLEPAKVHVRVESIRLFREMTEQDREDHITMLRAVNGSIEEMKKARSAQRSGILLATPGDLRGTPPRSS